MVYRNAFLAFDNKSFLVGSLMETNVSLIFDIKAPLLLLTATCFNRDISSCCSFWMGLKKTSQAFFLPSLTSLLIVLSMLVKVSLVAIPLSIIHSRIFLLQSNSASQANLLLSLYRSCDPEVE